MSEQINWEDVSGTTSVVQRKYDAVEEQRMIEDLLEAKQQEKR